MDLQNRYQQRQQLIILLLILKTIIANKKYWETRITRITNTCHLLAFIALTLATHMTNATIPFVLSLLNINNIRAQHQQRPSRTGGFWIEVFPSLTDEESYNSFQRHFCITLATFNFMQHLTTT